MNLHRKLSIGERAFVSIFNAGYRLAQGHTVEFAEELVRQHGIGGLMRESRANGDAWTALNKFWGQRMFLVSAFASFWNGCEYCAYGNIYAYNLHRFVESGELFPISEVEVVQLQRLRDQQVLEQLGERLKGHPEELRIIVRQHQLKMVQAEPSSEEDHMLVRANAIYDWINECSIVIQHPGPAFTSLARKKKVVEAYHQARKASGAPTVPPAAHQPPQAS